MDGKGLITLVVTAIIAIVIYSQLGASVLPASITGLSNTSAINGFTANATITGGFSGWNSATTSLWNTLPQTVTLVYYVLAFVLLMAVVAAI